ncbi:MAG: protein-disulfide reductase DsbD domain-containing protein [Sediminibacterium sp.]
MKQLMISAVCMLAAFVAGAQVQWNYSAKKIDDKTYELHLTASVQSPWHLYSQFTPEGGPLPSVIEFSKNPLISFEGAVKEEGRLVQKREEVFGIDVKYFEGRVDFVQKIKLKAKVKTNISGTVKYMVCNDRECLPPKTVSFQLELK